MSFHDDETRAMPHVESGSGAQESPYAAAPPPDAAQQSADPYGYQQQYGSAPDAFGYPQNSQPFGARPYNAPSPPAAQPYGAPAYGAPIPYDTRQRLPTSGPAIALIVVSAMATLGACGAGLPSLILGILAVNEKYDEARVRRFTIWGWVLLGVVAVLYVVFFISAFGSLGSGHPNS